MTASPAFDAVAGGYGPPDAVQRAAVAGARTAVKSVNRQLWAAVSIDQIRAHEHNFAAWLFSRAATPADEAFCVAYAECADEILADLAERQMPERNRMAARLATGTPHPDPVLAAKGWHVDCGVYVRTAGSEAVA
jgi:hypothetical protein